jgi:hypothetical protein
VLAIGYSQTFREAVYEIKKRAIKTNCCVTYWGSRVRSGGVFIFAGIYSLVKNFIKSIT